MARQTLFGFTPHVLLALRFDAEGRSLLSDIRLGGLEFVFVCLAQLGRMGVFQIELRTRLLN